MKGRIDDNDAFAYISDHIRTRGYAPSVREVADRCGCTRNAAGKLLRRLEQRGLITVVPRVARGIVVRADTKADGHGV